MTIYYAIGDIHGMFSSLEKLYSDITDDIAKNGYSDVEIVFLGDYIDRGPQSKQVLDFLRGLKDTDKVKHIFLMGNHEDMMLDGKGYVWLMNGGNATLNSFPDNKIPDDYYEWVKNLRTYYETENYIFVHAGLWPSVKPLDVTKEILLWVRWEFLDAKCDWGKLVIHGHTPINAPDIRSNRINVDTGAVFGGKLTSVVLEKDKPPKFIQV